MGPAKRRTGRGVRESTTATLAPTRNGVSEPHNGRVSPGLGGSRRNGLQPLAWVGVRN